MIKSMTGFGSSAAIVAPFGKISVEIRSTNHKFLETVVHLPEGFLALEERIKKEVETKVSRGRTVCTVNIIGTEGSGVFVNKDLLAKYISALQFIKGRFSLRGHISLDAIIHLPGVLSLAENAVSKDKAWPRLKILINRALTDLMHTRCREGAALGRYLQKRTRTLTQDLDTIKARFDMAVKKKLATLFTDEERSSFLKNSDITEEIERLTFHISNLKRKLSRNGPMGKELDFIAQEMQREANTIGAKSCSSGISAKVVEIKSKIEKIREQVQNIE